MEEQMTNIPLSAKVECVDGPCGESITVIVNPHTEKVTHVVVKDESLSFPAERLVPVEQILESTPDLIRLRCSKEDMEAMEPFIETRYIRTSEPVPMYGGFDSYQYRRYSQPYAAPAEPVNLPVDFELVPPGELAVHRGTKVEATDGHIGEVGELVVDPESGHVSHIVLREGHLWGKKELTLPISAIDHLEQDTLHLKLDKHTIGLLPTVPLKRNYKEGEGELALFAKVYDNETGASKALELVEDLHKRKTIRIQNAAVLVKDQDGNTTIKDTRDVDAKKGRLFGAITGGLIGLMAGPGGAVVGALAGAGTGGLAARKMDFGFSDEFLKSLQDHLQPGRSALIVLVEHQWADQLTEAMGGLEGVYFRESITDALVEDFLDTDQAEE
jgi:uncharacterized membrane protein